MTWTLEFQRARQVTFEVRSSRGVVTCESFPILGRWKTSYAYAELDSRRHWITEEEVAHFRWHLIYNGMPSSLGLRHFKRDGIFDSPHFGQTTWYLEGGGRSFVMQNVAQLQVQRNPENWGWIIGAGTGTEYHSKEIQEK
eukprot:TRINITY_DN16075_c0_g1_i1.p1 TRINITY_DN16075_c0_g1~~TRINITY_DN16075_c0_g1_i1.p1  ORF type:complete len:140 (-),score=17.48 TRINITY_DN16075_c0_g1_i1:372-791(-)